MPLDTKLRKFNERNYSRLSNFENDSVFAVKFKADSSVAKILKVFRKANVVCSNAKHLQRKDVETFLSLFGHISRRCSNKVLHKLLKQEQALVASIITQLLDSEKFQVHGLFLSWDIIENNFKDVEHGTCWGDEFLDQFGILKIVNAATLKLMETDWKWRGRPKYFSNVKKFYSIKHF